MTVGLTVFAGGAALAFAAGAVLVVGGVPADRTGLAGGVLNTAMELGPTVGLALISVVAAGATARLTADGSPSRAATAGGYGWGFAAAGAAALAVLAAVLTVPARTRPAASAPPTTPVATRAAVASRDGGTSVDTGVPGDLVEERRSVMAGRFGETVVLVTGGGSGIGRAVAVAFGREGASVAVAGRNEEALGTTVKEVEAAGGRAVAVVADVTRSAEVGLLVERTVAEYGRLDVAVNNAGALGAVGPVGDLDEGQWDDLVAVNVTGVLLSMKHEIGQMRRNGGGAIVNVASSLGAHKRVPGLGAYVATKAAVSALTRNAALDHIGEGIRINAVSPGPIDTPMSRRPGESDTERADRLREQLPAGRVGTLDEIAGTVLFLASPDAGFVVGADLNVDGGATA
jgi:NAD(P)-dependent dehydrogenase (short-subunit alcohol dehydrogenase family)